MRHGDRLTMSPHTFALMLVLAMGAVSCARGQQSVETTKAPAATPRVNNSNGSADGTVVTPPGDVPLPDRDSGSLANGSSTESARIPCRDARGAEVPGQFTVPSHNVLAAGATLVDCHDAKGTLVYPGAVRNCFDELSARFGPDVFHPAMQVVPGFYRASAAMGAGGTEHLRRGLQTKSCAELRSQYPG